MGETTHTGSGGPNNNALRTWYNDVRQNVVRVVFMLLGGLMVWFTSWVYGSIVDLQSRMSVREQLPLAGLEAQREISEQLLRATDAIEDIAGLTADVRKLDDRLDVCERDLAVHAARNP